MIFIKKFAEKTLDGSKGIKGGSKTQSGGMERRGGEDDVTPPRADDDGDEDSLGDDAFFDDDEENDFEEDIVDEDDDNDDVEGNGEGDGQQQQQQQPRESQQEPAPQVTTIDNNNPILERIKEKLEKLEFSLRSTINPEIKDKYLPKIVEGKWSGTMCLTEPVCGTDLGLLKTKAVSQSDGTYKITGQKNFYHIW